MTEEGNLVNLELTLTELSIQLMLPQPLQHKLQMNFMLCLRLGKDQNIINKDHHEDIQIIHENLVHQVHEESRGISQAERHDRILIQPILASECRLRNIPRTDPQLKITRTQINLREYTSTSKQIKEILLDSNCIQLPIINTHSLRAILLIYQQQWKSLRREAATDIALG